MIIFYLAPGDKIKFYMGRVIKYLGVAILLGYGVSIWAEDGLPVLPGEVISAMKSGNASLLARYFNSSIELEIMGKDAIYSKSQAEMIMKDFFSKNSPVNFTVRFEGGPENARYAVGTLATSRGNYRVNILIKDNLIHQLRIDRE